MKAKGPDHEKDAPLSLTRPAGGSEIIAVGGGKGGVGKSLLAASLGLAFADLGKRVLLVDADFGGANLHSCLGLPPPKATLSGFVDRKTARFADVVSHPLPNVSLVSGALDDVDAANPKYSQKLKLIREIGRFDTDVAIVDLGAGTSLNTLDFFLLADHGLVSVLPEPTSIENAYRFIKAAFFRRLKNLEHSFGLHRLVEGIMGEKEQRQIRTPSELLREIRREDPGRGGDLADAVAAFSFKLVINQVRNAEDHAVGANMRTVCAKYFGIEVEILGHIPYDNAVWQSVRLRQSLLRGFPDSPAAQAFTLMARKLAPRRARPEVLLGQARREAGAVLGASGGQA